MKLETWMQTMRPALETHMQQLIEQSVGEKFPGLRDMLAYHMGWEGEGAGSESQGKRIRPLLVLLCAQAAGAEWQDALPAAAAVELIHNFSLIHDDIQDNSTTRHGRPTMWVKWGAAQAINTGDVMYTLSFLALRGLSDTLPPAHVLLAHNILLDTCLSLTEGQYLDISYENSPTLPLESYWPMIGGKTSALLACSCELGALVAGAGTETRAHFRAYGSALGLAFQVLDDWLGIWGEPQKIGKSTTSDLVSGKKTLPVLYAMENDQAFARRWRAGAVRPEEVVGLARMLQEEGAAQKTLDTAQRLTEQAVQALEQATAGAHNEPDSGCAAQALRELTHILLERKN